MRRVLPAAIALVALGALGAVQASRAGASFGFDLEQTQPPLSHTAPVISDPHTPRLARRVILVIVDGLRYDRSFELPFLDELRRRGLDLEAQSAYPSWSRPNYVNILTGVPPLASGVRTNHHTAPVLLDSLMDRVHAAGLASAYASDYGLIPALFLRPTRALPAPVPDDEDDDTDETALDLDEVIYGGSPRAPDAPLVSPFDDSRYAPWPGGFAESGEALVAGNAELVVLLVGAVDAAGHAHGANSPAYREAAEQVDRALARVLAKVDLAQDAVIITADHGHTGRGGHGGTEPEVLSVPLVMAGAGIAPSGSVTDATLSDLAPTVAALLGIPAPGHGLGHTLVGALALDAAAAARRVQADNVRLSHTTAVVAAATAAAESRLQAHRTARVALVCGGALLAGLLALFLVRRRVMRFAPRLLVAGVPGFFLVYYALIAVFGERFSPSLVPADGTLAGALVKYGIAAMLAQLAASLWALRDQGSLSDRLAAANGLAWLGLTLAMVPAGLLWAVFPPPYAIVPGPAWLVLIPATLVSVACIAANVALTLVVEVIVFAARALYRAPGMRST
ncbi:MAG TPA: alkaline phosphatase family protein [Kofleriaceae bacterium]|jgi:hypothetical protein